METTIAVFPNQNSDRRLRVSLKSGSGQGGLQLVDESFSSHVGWYAQSSVDLTPEQVAALRTLLGTQSVRGKPKVDSLVAANCDKPILSIVRAG